jgi:thiol-disulfide isomerase/thioredoxin
MLMAVGGVLGVIAVFAALIIAKSLQSNPKPAKKSGAAPTAVVKNVTTVPNSAYDTIAYQSGLGGMTHVGGTPLTLNGKPLVVYVGADYCPYCAAERWPLVAALARFGTFTNLGATHSATGDVYPDTPTFSFHGTKYTSKYVAFSSVELYGNRPVGNSYPVLETPDATQKQLLSKYDPRGTIPFIYLGNWIQESASYNPQILAGMTMTQISQALRNPQVVQSQGILGEANRISAAICKLTNGQPANVCTSKGVVAAAKHLPAK